MKFFSDKNGKFIYGVKSVLAILHLACLIYAKHIPLAFTLLGDQYLKEMSGLLKACWSTLESKLLHKMQAHGKHMRL